MEMLDKALKKETVSEMERNKSQLREAESYNFSEIYKRFHDGSLKNYEDVKFVSKPQKEALQYVENVLNYLTGTPGKCKQRESIFSMKLKVKIDDSNIYSEDYQMELLKMLLKPLEKVRNVFVYAIDIDLRKEIKDSIQVIYLIYSNNSINKWVNYTQCCNWHYVFPNYKSWLLNPNIQYLWVGFDGVEWANGQMNTPCNIYMRCSSNPYEIDRILEYAANNIIKDNNNIAVGQYYVNVVSIDYWIDNVASTCVRSRLEVQGMIQSLVPYITCSPIPFKTITSCPSGKEFMFLDVWHIAGPCPCSCYKDKWLRADIFYGTTSISPPWL